MAEPTFAVGTGEDATPTEPATPTEGEKPPEQKPGDEPETPISPEDQATKDKAEAEKKAADAQAANTAAKALLFDSMADLKLPDGTITDEKMAGEFTNWAKENKLTKVQAQQAADMHLKTIGVFAQKLQAEAQQQVKTWADEITNDKELGGAKVKETIQTAEKYFALAEQVPGVNINRLKADMVRTGMANHPDMIRVSRFIGQHLGDDNLFISDRSTGGGPTDVATILYGDKGVIQK